MVIIDEAQFFSDLREKVLFFCESLGKTVIVTGLLTDANRKPFGQTLEVVGLADVLHNIDEGLCDDCLLNGVKSKSIFSRKIGASNNGKIVVGKDEYRGVCRGCWIEGQTSKE